MPKNSDKIVVPPILNAGIPSVLSAIYRDILFDLGISGSKFSMLLEKYVRSTCRAKDNVNTSNHKNTLKKELLGVRMTWKVFIKGLGFLSVTKMDLSIKLTYKYGNVTTHNKTINLEKPNVDTK